MDRTLLTSSYHIVFVLVFSEFIYLSFAQDDLFYLFCGDNDTDSRSAEIKNRDDVLAYLANKDITKFTHGFVNYSLDQNTPDEVNGLALCIADLDPDDCVTCLSDARRRLYDFCRVNLKTDAIGWYFNCMIRYSNISMLNTLNTENSRTWTNQNYASHKDSFDKVLKPLLERIKTQAASENLTNLGKFATGMENVTDPSGTPLTIYGLMQCTPDLTKSECIECLDFCVQKIESFCDGKIGCRTYTPSCIMRYEIEDFFNKPQQQAQPPPGVPMPQLSNNTSKNATSVPMPQPSNNNSSVVVTGIAKPSILPPNRRKDMAVILATTLSATLVVAIFIVLGFKKWRRRIQTEQQGPPLYASETDDQTLLEGSSEVYGLQNNEDKRGNTNFFNLRAIEEATDNFSIENKLGEGGFGPVYKGTLNDGSVVAIKRLSIKSGQGLREFITEVKLIVKLQHINLVRLLGCCTQKEEKILVYEFMPNSSLDTFLFDKTKSSELDWSMRAHIVSGIAKGLRYLHEESRLRIIHRDLKASNILLDSEMNAKISDFGTARIFGVKQTQDETARIVGTYGYMAPEYAMEGVFSVKSDVYSFGVLLLEVITGQKSNGSSQSYAWTMWKEGTTEKLIDENISKTSLIIGDVKRWTNIALLCLQENPNDRPTMSSVISMLEGQLISLPQPSEPPFFTHRLIISDESSSTGIWTSSSISASDSNTR